ncbi:hypothetical protein IU500_07875 [Nocardia terpenica]|uniref:Uncharacterized protein n=1 Tax=Nocardia terpenica TaxID=455432 RepID=A0A164KDN5_9NOCA|nr:DUF6401 family natural product biosynthesis protein [Nocardia terpenica]KZM71294.1 hypothetical protein AWN90_00465 [Nocardia terpenica]MBF6060694.1 hypothetical protein [Nocardia terpenica]MBF6103954.1 hypothetical protein [Nocardia terpenica]MBF6111672.1 hypothetical protein [Nocardia terpenica]MBF6118175.1 hypothetical protein [Nocardia terpenica]
MFLLGSALLEASARKTLNRLHKTHGAPASAAARELPVVCAALDQHAAAVRDILDLGVENSDATPVSVLLAGYARGLLEHSGRAAVRAPRDLDDWAEADWLQLRLAGVCQLAAAQA